MPGLRGPYGSRRGLITSLGSPRRTARAARAPSLDAVLDALADPTRRGLFEELLESGGASATHLAAGVNISRQAVVKHLQVLAAAGLAAAERSGREVRYRAVPGALHDAAAWMVDAGAAWDRRLARLRRKLEAASGSPIDDQGLQRSPDTTRTVRDR